MIRMLFKLLSLFGRELLVKTALVKKYIYH